MLKEDSQFIDRRQKLAENFNASILDLKRSLLPADPKEAERRPYSQVLVDTFQRLGTASDRRRTWAHVAALFASVLAHLNRYPINEDTMPASWTRNPRALLMAEMLWPIVYSYRLDPTGFGEGFLRVTRLVVSAGSDALIDAMSEPIADVVSLGFSPEAAEIYCLFAATGRPSAAGCIRRLARLSDDHWPDTLWEPLRSLEGTAWKVARTEDARLKILAVLDARREGR